jgi:hypothetical protein
MIRHARGRRLATEPVLPLPVAMILPAFLAALVPSIRTSALTKAGLPAARLTAIAMATIAMGADEKDGVAVLCNASHSFPSNFSRYFPAEFSDWRPNE